MKRYSIQIRGLVQGVWFRKYTRMKALELGLRGFVMNKPDGSVYAEAEGDEKILEEFKAWCLIGSPLSKVESVDAKEIPLKADEGFEIVGEF